MKSIVRLSSPLALAAACLLVAGCGARDGDGGPSGGRTLPPVKVVAFDEAQAVLQGIADGTVVGTVVQNPFQYGYQSVTTLHALTQDKADAIPESKFINIPARVVLADESRAEFAGAEVVPVATFRSELKKLLAGGGSAATGEGPDYAFITNGVADFWTIGKVGAEKAAADLGVKSTVIMPSSITDQTRKIEDLLTRGTSGIAISPINPANQGEVLGKAAAATNLITHDSDAPDSPRKVYIGMDNYEAGLVCGRLTRDALPDGGKIMLFIGRLDQDNAQRRRQGCIDGILGREPNPSRRDDPGTEIKSDDGKYVILGTLTDQFDRAKAKANAEDALLRHPDVAAMVGLFEYNPPLILEALERAGRLTRPAAK
ncbi:MAG: substrate-binding domain-containing protein [Planctomycetes bacterium]|nr:substrate-binding domain-containing protein [Planctomycetota bacterium]